MQIDFENMADDDYDAVSGDELYDDLIDYMIDLGMDDEAIDLALNALESGDYDRIENTVPQNTTPEEIETMVSLYLDWAETDFIDDGIPDEEGVAEAVLTLAQRRKRALTMRRFKTKLKAARKRMSKRAASSDVISKRARRAAIKAVRSKVAGSKAGNYANLTPGEKAVIDARVAKRKAAVDRLAKRMVTKVRKADRDRLKSNASVKEGVEIATFTQPYKEIEPNFPVDDDESAKPLGWYQTYTQNRWLPQFKLSGEGDRRYAMFKQMQESFSEISEMDQAGLMNLMAEAEIRGIDVKEITENVTGDLSESAIDRSAIIAELVRSLAVRMNLVEKLEAIAEDRDPHLVCESTGESCMFITPKQIKMFEKLCDEMFAKFNIEFSFTKHFAERMSDSRNTPCLTLKELADFVKKMYRDSGKKLKDAKDTEAVLKDIQTNINIPVAVEYNRGKDEFDVVFKTIMRKKDFKTPNKTIRY